MANGIRHPECLPIAEAEAKVAGYIKGFFDSVDEHCRAKEALRESLRVRATDPALAEERRITIAAKQAKRMRGVVVEIRRKKING
ncbi:MAG: hypothetical protein QHD01_05860 [Bradyrhizobium sp.]|uniref:hypothetical protein n=1 Tax=Bradyrhizobium sp. TaxID=376 RepID=UPI0029AAD998|nr:hypothetical protein [Bradyrhizobium sp.]MDX3966110.1 hypothetical protein [Bradyrhizobium sp.]